ncbi:PBECR2 nuclease fold domain-containing protein [Selenomonas sp. FC4001]|uniref:PBECR3 domain-containing polyvalent protein n=1 Tax=Selenomonas sp. FC4001 TaxID=1408313 RepID=UPI00055E8E30|nr:PBECR2 nuclease fold domain-containing protein [Selenomonas sp. FC4001]
MKPIAHISKKVIDALGLDITENTPIYLGESNIKHMKQRHFADYDEYGDVIADILNQPEYVGKNPKDDSIEYVREYKRTNDEFVKVAVRISLKGRYYARSLYVLSANRVRNFIRKGTLKDLTK